MPNFVVVGGKYTITKSVVAKILSEEGAVLKALFADPVESGGAVKLASQNDIPIFHAKELKKAEILDQLVKLDADWLINAYGTVIIPGRVLELYQGHALNLHPGPLPEYAGLHMNQWAIRNGETQYGVTMHFMEPGVDTGPIVQIDRFPIKETETGFSLFNSAMKAGANLFDHVLSKIIAGEELPSTIQDLSKRRLYRTSDALDGKIDPNWTVDEVLRFIRASDYGPFSSPTYNAELQLPSGNLQIDRAEASDQTIDMPHKIVADGLLLKCRGGACIKITRAKLNGRILSEKTWGEAGILD